MVDFLINVRVDPRGAVTGAKQVERALGRVDNRADRLRQTLFRAFAFVGVAATVRQITTYADTLTNLQNRLRLVTNGTENLTQVTEELFDIAIRTRSSFASTGELYARVALSAKELGRSQRELLQFTESLNKAVILSGAASEEARNGIIQLSQGIASGALRGDELRSVLEQLPAVADVIAKQLGITRGELRELGAQGKITSDIILDAFKEAREELNDRFATTVPTIGQSFEVLRTRVIEFIGTVDQAGGVTDKLAKVILLLAENAETLLRSLTALATFMITVFIQRAILGTIKALASLSVALLTNPIFAIGALIAGSVAAIVGFGDEIKATEDGLATLHDVVITAFNAISQTVTPILQQLSDTMAAVFGGQLPTLREFAESIAFALDRIIGAVRGYVLLVNDLLTTQLGAVFNGAINLVGAFGLRTLKKFEEIANGLVNLFIDPINTILRAIQTLISSVAGAAAVAAQLGVISEESRLEVEDTISGLEVAIRRLESGREPVKLFDTEETDRQIAELENNAATAFNNVGTTLKNSFLEGFDRTTTLDLVKSVFDEAEIRAQERAAEEARLAAARENETRGQPSPLDVVPERISKTGEEVEKTRLKALEAATDIGSGFERAFIKMSQEARDFASVAENALNAFADRATDAIVDFVETGKFSFKEFAQAIIADLLRILTRLLVVQALSAALGALNVGGGAANTAANAGAGVAPQLLGRQKGGTVQPDRSFVVGENGPEIFQPQTTGTIIPNPADAGTPPPELNLQVVNVDDPRRIVDAIASGEADDAIINMLTRKKDAVQRTIQR